jgi:hypothetical protein
MAWHFLPDVSGPGVFNIGALAADNGEIAPQLYRAIQVVATGSGTARLGGSSVGATGPGLPFAAPNGSQFLPYVGEMCLNSLNSLNVYVPAGCTVSISYEH